MMSYFKAGDSSEIWRGPLGAYTAHVENHRFPPQGQPGRLCNCLHMANARTVTVLLQAEIFRFLFTCTFLKLKSLSTCMCLRFNVHHIETKISFQLTYDNTNKAVRKWSTLVTLNTFLALCFYIKQLSNNTWRKKPVVPDTSVLSHPSTVMFTRWPECLGNASVTWLYYVR
jgi:hypothetical protein